MGLCHCQSLLLVQEVPCRVLQGCARLGRSCGVESLLGLLLLRGKALLDMFALLISKPGSVSRSKSQALSLRVIKGMLNCTSSTSRAVCRTLIVAGAGMARTFNLEPGSFQSPVAVPSSMQAKRQGSTPTSSCTVDPASLLRSLDRGGARSGKPSSTTRPGLSIYQLLKCIVVMSGQECRVRCSWKANANSSGRLPASPRVKRSHARFDIDSSSTLALSLLRPVCRKCRAGHKDLSPRRLTSNALLQAPCGVRRRRRWSTSCGLNSAVTKSWKPTTGCRWSHSPTIPTAS